MKRIPAIAVLLFAAIPAFGQTSNSVPFTAVTPPAAPAITSLSGLSSTGKIYTGATMPINGTGFTSSCVVNVDGTAQPTSTFAFVSATRIDFTIPASLGSSSGTAHTLTVSCPVPLLTMNGKSPVALPNGKAGTAYNANLVSLANVSGGVSPYKCNLLSGSLPMGISLSQSCVVSGTPSSAGSFTFSFIIADSSGLATIIEIEKGEIARKFVFSHSSQQRQLLAKKN